MSITTVMTKPVISVNRQAPRRITKREFERREKEYWSTHGPQTVDELIVELDASRKRMARGEYLTEDEAHELEGRMRAQIKQYHEAYS